MKPSEKLFSIYRRVTRPTGFFIIGGCGVAALAVYGRFDHSPQRLHEVAWIFIAVGAFVWMAGKSPDEPNVWRGAGKALFVYWVLGAFLLFPVVMSDGDFYYGVIRSMLWDRDVNTHNEAVRYAHGWLAEQGPMGGPFGFPSHPFPIGASLSWIPFIAAGHVEALVRHLWDPWLPLNGYAEPYVNWVAVGTATWGGVFVVFAYLLCRFRFPHGVAMRAVIGGLMATPGFYYCFRDAGFPHAHSMAVLAFFCWAWLADPGRCDLRRVGILAVALSAAAMIRWQNCLFALAPMLYWVFVDSRAGSFFVPSSLWERIRVRGMGICASLVLGISCLVLSLPQLVFFRIRGPGWLSLEHAPGSWSWASPKFYSMLFDEKYGIWGWHPFYFLAVFGGVLLLGFRFSRRGKGNPRGPDFPSGGQRPPREKIALTLLLGIAFIEVYISASYVLWHGGALYGNRLIVDLLIIFVLGFAGVLHLASERGKRRLVASLWVGCLSWSFSRLRPDVLMETFEFKDTPVPLTEVFAHTTPAARVAQGIGHIDLSLLIAGLWLFLTLGLSLGLLYAAVLIARGLFLGSKKNAYRILSSFVVASIGCSLWFWIDLRHVDAALFMDNRVWRNQSEGKREVELVRQAFNSELVGWYPPGHEDFYPQGERRLRLFLSEATPEFKSSLPMNWPEPTRAVPYICERVAVLSRVHAARPLFLGEPIASFRLERFAPPSVTEWTLRAGIDTDTPTSLRLPPSSPDWYLDDVSSIPRFFTADLPANPTQELEYLEISLIPKDVTLEVGAIWFSTSTPSGFLQPNDRPKFREIPEYDRLLFDREKYISLSFPVRYNLDVDGATDHLFPRPIAWNRPDKVFGFFRDPWRLAGDVPIQLAIGDCDGTRPPSWHVLDWRQPTLEIPIRREGVAGVHVALAAGEIPGEWTQAPLVILEAVGAGGDRRLEEIFPGEEIAFWDEPYQPTRRLAWFEKRWPFPPITVPVVSVKGFEDETTEKLIVRLAPRGIETGAQIAVLGITVEFE